MLSAGTAPPSPPRRPQGKLGRNRRRHLLHASPLPATTGALRRKPVKVPGRWRRGALTSPLTPFSIQGLKVDAGHGGGGGLGCRIRCPETPGGWIYVNLGVWALGNSSTLPRRVRAGASSTAAATPNAGGAVLPSMAALTCPRARVRPVWAALVTGAGTICWRWRVSGRRLALARGRACWANDGPLLRSLLAPRLPGRQKIHQTY